MGVPDADDVTVAVKVTDCPLVEGFADDVKIVVVGEGVDPPLGE